VNDFDPLMMFTTEQSDDLVKRDLELTCSRCGFVVCDVQDGDLLSILANVADDHWQEAHPGDTG
jgi:hypothetical protein